jgi:hypothetical protein
LTIEPNSRPYDARSVSFATENARPKPTAPHNVWPARPQTDRIQRVVRRSSIFTIAVFSYSHGGRSRSSLLIAPTSSRRPPQIEPTHRQRLATARSSVPPRPPVLSDDRRLTHLARSNSSIIKNRRANFGPSAAKTAKRRCCETSVKRKAGAVKTAVRRKAGCRGKAGRCELLRLRSLPRRSGPIRAPSRGASVRAILRPAVLRSTVIDGLPTQPVYYTARVVHSPCSTLDA